MGASSNVILGQFTPGRWQGLPPKGHHIGQCKVRLKYTRNPNSKNAHWNISCYSNISTTKMLPRINLWFQKSSWTNPFHGIMRNWGTPWSVSISWGIILNRSFTPPLKKAAGTSITVQTAKKGFWFITEAGLWRKCSLFLVDSIIVPRIAINCSHPYGIGRSLMLERTYFLWQLKSWGFILLWRRPRRQW